MSERTRDTGDERVRTDRETRDDLDGDRTEVVDTGRTRHPDLDGPQEERRATAADRRDADGYDAVGSDRVVVADHAAVVAREEEEFGGIKIGSAFFGWLTATGMAVVLTALLAAAGAAVGISTGTDAQEAADKAGQSTDTVGIVGGVVLLVILFVAYYCGGYVAGRMARFHGSRQGLAVWLWAVVIALLVALLAIVAGNQYDVLGQLNSFPRLPVSTSDLTTGGIVALVVVAVAALVGAMLGGAAGMRFHRRVDRVGLAD